MTANAILAEELVGEMPVAQSNSKLSENNCWDAVVARDPARDGEFVFAVSTTGVYCRPSCPARRPRRNNVTFYSRPEQAEKAGHSIGVLSIDQGLRYRIPFSDHDALFAYLWE